MTRLLLILATILMAQVSRAMDLDEIQDYLDATDAQVLALDYCNRPSEREQEACNDALRLERLERENKRLAASINSRGVK